MRPSVADNLSTLHSAPPHSVSVRSQQAFVAIVITALLSLGLVAIVAASERLVAPWYYVRLRAVRWNSDEDE